MAISDENMVMPVSPMGNFGGGFGGDSWGWIILLLLFAGGGFGGFGGGDMYPWLNQSNQVNDGFRDQMISSSVNGIQNAVTSGFGDIQTALCGGFAGVNATVNANQMADLERSFASQTATTAGFANLSAQLSQCCCDNRLATVQTQNVVSSEGAATRLAIQNQTNSILDKLCQMELDNLKSENLALQNQVNMLNLSASQTQQTAQLIADNTAQTQYIVNRISPYPVPAFLVNNPNTPSV